MGFDIAHRAAIASEESRIGRMLGDSWPIATAFGAGVYLAMLRKVPSRSGMRGLVVAMYAANNPDDPALP